MNHIHILKIEEKHEVKDYEELIKKMSDSENVELCLSGAIQSRGFGRSASLVQFIATYVKKRTESDNTGTAVTINVNLAGKIREYRRKERSNPTRSDPIKRAIDDFASTLWGCVAGYYADKIICKDVESDLKNVLLEKIESRMKAAGRFDYKAKGRLAQVIFRIKDFHTGFYVREPAQSDIMVPAEHVKLIAGFGFMKQIIIRTLNAMNLPKKAKELLGKKTNIGSGYDLLAIILREVFANTAEHGFLSKSGKIPDKGIRVILFSYSPSLESAEIECSFSSIQHPEMKKYITNLGSEKRTNMSMLEFSVLDTGMNFAESMRSRFPKLSDKELVEKCFQKYVSRNLNPNAGIGLTTVLSKIKQLKGILRLRTSTVEGFFCHEFPDDGNGNIRISENLPEVVGSLLTIIIPLNL